MAKKRARSSWTQRLLDTRVVLHPVDMVGTVPIQGIDPAALGIFFRLLPYLVANGLSTDMRSISRLSNVHIRTLKKHWPEVSELLVLKEDGWRVAELSWLRVQTVSADRQSLRHLLDKLVAFWGSACAYCGAEAGALHIEHIVPVVRGGSDDLTNLTLACQSCNSRKRTKTAAEFGYPHIHDMASRIQ